MAKLQLTITTIFYIILTDVMRNILIDLAIQRTDTVLIILCYND
jgi:hypothetical protein